jgi:hypothetical protein
MVNYVKLFATSGKYEQVHVVKKRRGTKIAPPSSKKARQAQEEALKLDISEVDFHIASLQNGNVEIVLDLKNLLSKFHKCAIRNGGMIDIWKDREPFRIGFGQTLAAFLYNTC